MRKNSLLKKFAAVAAAAAVIVGTLGITVTASDYEGAGDDKGSITVYKYSRVSQSNTTNPSGEKVVDTSGFGTPLSGVGYTLYKLAPLHLNEGEVVTEDYSSVIDEATGTGTVTIITNQGTINVSAVKEEGEFFTDPDGKIVFGKSESGDSLLDQGHYLLVESTPPDGYEEAEPAIISLPLTKSTGDGYVYDIHVYPKNISNLPITKIIDDTSKTYKVGDQISFTIDAALKNDAATPNTVTSVNDLRNPTAPVGEKYGQVKIIDKLVSSLVYDSSTVHYLTDTSKKIPLTIGTHYTLDNTNPYVWELTEAGIDYIIDNEGTNGKAITLEVNIVATIQVSDEQITNQASSFVKKAGATEDPEPPITPPVVVPTGEVIINKTNSDGTEPLAGAKFAIATNEAATSFLLSDGTTVDNITSLAQLKAKIAEHEASSTLANIVVATTVINGTKGHAAFSGLKYDKDNGSVYKLVEIEAPAGYQLKEASIDATLVSGTPDGQVATYSANVKNYKDDQIDPDNPKFALPLTGGSGTLLFTLIGIVIMAATVIIYLRSKSKKKA